MIFYEPFYLWLIVLLPLYWILQNRAIKKKQAKLKTILSPSLMERFNGDLDQNSLKKILHCITLLALIICLARPQWGESLSINKQRGIAIGFLIDLSNSMYASDIKPSRLKILQLDISNFLKKLNGDEVGLVGFANSAFIAAPLSTDYRSLEEYVFSLSPAVIRNQGTDIGNAIKEGLKLFNTTASTEKALILISDGEDHGSHSMDEAYLAKKMGVRIYTIGLGTREGSPIELFDSEGKSLGYLKNKENKIVMSNANFDLLKQVSNATGGVYTASTTGDLHLDEIYKDIKNLDQTDFKEKVTSLKEEKYYFPLILAFFSLCLEFFPEILRRISSFFSRLKRFAPFTKRF